MKHTYVAAGGDVNLADGWDKLWNPIKSSFPALPTLLSIVGVAVVVLAIGKYVWDRRRGGGGDSKRLGWAMVIGALFAAPALVLPLALKVVDWIINTVVQVFQGAT
jgi:hypothetical protein